MGLAFVFPGQGSQDIGMGKALAESYPAAAAVFAAVDEALEEPLSRLIWEGPQDALTLTQNAQPALFAVSLAAVAALKAEFGFDIANARFVAGHSLGEYSALAAAGALGIADGARLLRLRGRAMQAAAPVGSGAMASLIGPKVDIAFAEAAAAAGAHVAPCVVANDNNPGNVVISGAAAGVEAAIAWAKANGARAIPLAVSAPFHSPLMAPAAEAMRAALADVAIAAPRPALIANVTAAPESDPARLAALLVEQVTGRVRWRETLESLPGLGVTRLVELGAGKVLTGMAKRVVPDLAAYAGGNPAELAALAPHLQG